MTNIVERLLAWAPLISGGYEVPAAGMDVLEAADEIDRLKQNDREAAEYVETPICMRTNFTGDPPYVGWRGLGLALEEALDERDRLRAINAEMREALKQIAAETHGAVDDPDASRINRIASRAFTPDGCGREGKHQWGGPEGNREVCVNCGATRVLEGGNDG